MTWPEFSLGALFGIALPLFIVTMTSQNMPGITILRAHGYQPATSSLITWTGLTGLLLAPFGGYAFNLAAITAAICMGKRWIGRQPALASGSVGRRLLPADRLFQGHGGGAVHGLPGDTSDLCRRAGAARHHRQQPAHRIAARRCP